MGAHLGAAYRVNQAIVGVGSLSHAPQYQRTVYISSPHSLIGVAAMLLQKLCVANDPAFGPRLKALIKGSPFKNGRRFAIDGMGWSEDNGPQRLTNYLKGRVPEVETLVVMADKLQCSLPDLLGLDGSSSAGDVELQDILRQLLALEGIGSDRADTITNAALAARRLYRAFPDDEPSPTRAKYAVRAAWFQQQSQDQDTQPA